MNARNIHKLKPGDEVKFKDYKWIVLDSNIDGGVMVIMKSPWMGQAYCFDENGKNNYKKSSLRTKLINHLLPILGEDNFIRHRSYLIADNGDGSYGTVTDKIFILNCDEYRRYYKYVPLFSEGMWTCTPWYIPEDADNEYQHIRYVDSEGVLYYSNTQMCLNILPACIFDSDKLCVNDDNNIIPKMTYGELALQAKTQEELVDILANSEGCYDLERTKIGIRHNLNSYIR